MTTTTKSRKPVTPQIAALPGMTPLGIPAHPVLAAIIAPKLVKKALTQTQKRAGISNAKAATKVVPPNTTTMPDGTVRINTADLRTIRLTSLQAALLFKADKALKASLTVVAKAPVVAGEKPDWYKVQATEKVAQTVMGLFTAMSKAKTSPIKMRLHQHAVCGAAARYLGDLLSGGATVAVLASKHGGAKSREATILRRARELTALLPDDSTKIEAMDIDVRGALAALRVAMV